MISPDSLLALLLLFGQPPQGEARLDASSPPDSDAPASESSENAGSGPNASEPDTPEPDALDDADLEGDADMMNALFGPAEDDDGPVDAGAASVEGQGAAGDDAPAPAGEPTASEQAPEVGGAELETAGEPPGDGDEALDLGDIFGDGSAIEELPSTDELESAGPASGSGLFGGKLDLRLRVMSSVYIDIDNLYQGRRWNPSQPGLGESVERPSAFRVGQSIPRGTVSRNENRLEFYLDYQPNKHIQIVGDIQAVFLGVSQVSTLNDLATQQLLTPFHFESDSAYIAIIDALPNLDIKIGRQIVVWGTADKFSPTNNINPDDLEDRPLFTEPIGNQMVVVDYAPLQDKLWFQGVYVPLFYPALLPPSASFALADPQSPVDFANQSDDDKLEFLQGFITANQQFNPRVRTNVQQPPINIMNGQAAFKVGSRIGPVDLSGSYYYGFFDIPIPFETESRNLGPLNEEGVDGYWFESDVTLVYPRMHVVGLDFSAQLPFLDDMGLWGEGALIIPQRGYDFRVELPLRLDITPDDGVANPVSEFTGPIVRPQPFFKATVGADYTIGKHVYLQAQYLRGFINDFGAGNIGNYLVAGTDLIFFGRHLIFRLFTVTEFPGVRSERPSLALAPNLIMVPPWGYATIELGGFAFFGRRDTFFGQAATGSSIVFAKVTGSF